MNGVPRVPIEGEFQLAAGEVRVSVVVGEMQQGYSLVSFDDTDVVEGERIEEHPVGDPGDLRGRTLYTDTTVTVTNPATTRTAVTIIMTQAGRTQQYPGARQLSALGDTLIYEGTIRFTDGTEASGGQGAGAGATDGGGGS